MPSSPAFQFYPGDFLADENQILMELAEVGAYIRLICVCWNEGSIPNDMRKLAKLVGTTQKEMTNIWRALEPCFDPHPVVAERLIHPRLEKERRKQAAYQQKMSDAGKKGAERRRSKAAPEPQESSSQALARLEPGIPEASTGLLSSSVMSLASAESPITEQPQRVDVVENSVPEYAKAPEYSRFDLLDAAKRECGMGLWNRREESTANSVIVSWQGEGKSPGDIWGAVHGSRLLVDRGAVDWLAPKQPFGLQSLRNTFTLADQGDGRAQRPLFDVALEEYVRGGSGPRRSANTGPVRVHIDPMQALGGSTA